MKVTLKGNSVDNIPSHSLLLISWDITLIMKSVVEALFFLAVRVVHFFFHTIFLSLGMIYTSVKTCTSFHLIMLLVNWLFVMVGHLSVQWSLYLFNGNHISL